MWQDRRRIPGLGLSQLAAALACLLPLLCASLCGARELLHNGSFERDADGDGIADGWSLERHQGAEGDARLAPGLPQHGKFSQHVRHSNASAEWVRVSASDLPACADALVRLHGWVKASGTWKVLFYEFVGGGKYLTHSVASGGNTDWIPVAATFRTASKVSSFKVSLITSGRGEAWFDGFSLRLLGTAPQMHLPELAAPPTIDGVADESAWQDAALLEDFLLLGGEGQPPQAATKVRLGIHDKTLFVAWTCSEPRMSELKLGAIPSWADDTVELFLSPPHMPGGFHQFGVTAAGGNLESSRNSSSRGYYTDWYSAATTADAAPPATPAYKAAAQQQADSWSAEMAIELPTQAQTPKPWGVQVARSRKLRPDFEENSTWAYTPGSTFHQPEYFARTTLPGATVVTAEPIAPRPANHTADLLLVPPVKQVSLLRRPPIPVREPLPVAVQGEGAEQARTIFEQEVQRRTGLTVQALAATDGAPVLLAVDPTLEQALRRERPELTPWQIQEAYELRCDNDRIRLRAAALPGLRLGVQTLLQLLARQESGWALRAADITDWPDMQWRGWHLIAPERSAAVAPARRLIDVLAGLKFNWIALQIDTRLTYKAHPALNRPDTPTADELRSLVAHAESYGMEVIPMTQCWSHFNRFLANETYRHLAEIPDPEPSRQRKYWNYCPRHPETHPFLFSLIEEQLACFPNAKYFHVGLDEITFEPIGVCERCRSASGGELLAEEVARLHAFLSERGLRMCMWGDQLLVEHNGKPPHRTAEALPQIPRDVIIFDWHYNRSKSFPSVPFFASHGFEVVACGWYEPENVAGLTAEAQRNGILGYGGTTWYAINRIREEIRLITGIPLSAARTWSADQPPLAQTDASLGGVFRRLYDGAAAPMPSAFRPLDLRVFFNSSLEDMPGRGSHLDPAGNHDLSALPHGRQWFAGVPFDIPQPDQPQCLILRSREDPPERLPEQVCRIPIRRRARALALLQTCSHPERFSRHIYDRQGVNPGTVLTCVFHYADGSSIPLNLRWNVHLSSWNSQLGSAYAEPGWEGRTKGGAIARVEVLKWENPRPEAVLEAIDLVSGLSTVRPAILGITLID